MHSAASDLGLHCLSMFHKKEGQEALNRSPEFYLKLTYRHLLKAGLVPGDTWGGATFDPRCIICTYLVEVH